MDTIKYLIANNIQSPVLLGMYCNNKEYYWDFGKFTTSNYFINPHRCIFDMGSLSSIITTLAILKSGVDIHSPIKNYLNQMLPMPLSAMPVATLLNHSSGLPQVGRTLLENSHMLLADTTSVYDHNVLDQDLANANLRDIGINETSHLGMALAGRVLENATKTDFSTFVHRYLLVPLGMSDSTYNIRNDVERYSRLVKCDQEYCYGSMNPAMGLKTSSRDMMRLLRANLRLESELEPMVRQMQHHYRLDRHYPVGKKHGLGWELHQSGSVFLSSSRSDDFSIVMCGHVDKPIGMYMVVFDNLLNIDDYGLEVLNLLLRSS